jgi:hypothetical protein
MKLHKFDIYGYRVPITPFIFYMHDLNARHMYWKDGMI